MKGDIVGQTNVKDTTNVKDSPEEKRQKRVDEEVKDDETYIDTISDVEELKKLYKKDLRASVRRRLLEEDEKLEYKTKYETSELDKGNLKLMLETAEAELNARPYVELLQRKVMPSWLLNDEDLTSESKWECALEFTLTKTARILLRRIDENVPSIGVSTVAVILHDSYDVFSEILEHKKNVRPLKLSNAAWDSFFNKVGITDPAHQDAFKLLVQPFTKEDYNEVIKIDAKENYIFLVKYLDISVSKDGENETSRKITERYDEFSFVKFYYPKDRRGRYTNMVIFLLEFCSSKKAYEMHQLLIQNPRNDCTVNVKYDIYNPNEY